MFGFIRVLFLYSSSASFSAFFTRLHFWAHCLQRSTATLSHPLYRLLNSLSPEHLDASGPESARHPYSDVRTFSAIFPPSATIGLPLSPGVAASHLTIEGQHPLLSTAAPVAASTATFHMRARPGPYLSMAKASHIQASCDAVVWDNRQKSDIVIHAASMLEAVLGRSSASRTPARKYLLPSCASAKCPSRGRYPYSDEHLPIPPELRPRRDVLCLNISEGRPISQKFRWLVAGLTKPLNAHEWTHA